MSFRLPLRWSTAYFRLPRTSVPRPLPATRITKRSFGPSLKISSIGTRASEQPRMAANGRCFGSAGSPAKSPRSLGSTETIFCVLPSSSFSPSRSAANARLPSFNRMCAALLSGGRGLGGHPAPHTDMYYRQSSLFHADKQSEPKATDAVAQSALGQRRSIRGIQIDEARLSGEVRD